MTGLSTNIAAEESSSRERQIDDHSINARNGAMRWRLKKPSKSKKDVTEKAGLLSLAQARF
jgi:hypothetical protein